MTSRIDLALQFQENALRLREKRQEVIASNIANADTPHYQARDIDFSSALHNALAGNNQSLSLASRDQRHLGTGTTSSSDGTPLLYRPVIQPSADGNTVDLNVERANFSENTIRYEASLKFASQQIKDILTVLQG